MNNIITAINAWEMSAHVNYFPNFSSVGRFRDDEDYTIPADILEIVCEHLGVSSYYDTALIAGVTVRDDKGLIDDSQSEEIWDTTTLLIDERGQEVDEKRRAILETLAKANGNPPPVIRAPVILCEDMRTHNFSWGVAVVGFIRVEETADPRHKSSLPATKKIKEIPVFYTQNAAPIGLSVNCKDAHLLERLFKG